jgi:Flp pilus assembly protein TadG
MTFRQIRDRGDGLGDDGAAVVEFVLVSVLLLGLFLSVVQLGFALYVRNTLVACAADGARYAANADRSPADGAQQTRALIRRSLPDRFADDVAAGYEPASDTVFVQVRASLPILGPWGIPNRLVLRGHALEEAR